MELKQNDRDHLIDMVQRGEMTAAQANVKKVLMQRVLLVTSRIPADVRRALNAAVKRGELGHMKDGGNFLEAEVYYHPQFEYLAKEERQNYGLAAAKAAASAIKMGVETAFSAQESAEALQLLAAAGLDVEESQKALPGMLQMVLVKDDSHD